MHTTPKIHPTRFSSSSSRAPAASRGDALRSSSECIASSRFERVNRFFCDFLVAFSPSLTALSAGTICSRAEARVSSSWLEIAPYSTKRTIGAIGDVDSPFIFSESDKFWTKRMFFHLWERFWNSKKSGLGLIQYRHDFPSKSNPNLLVYKGVFAFFWVFFFWSLSFFSFSKKRVYSKRKKFWKLKGILREEFFLKFSVENTYWVKFWWDYTGKYKI